MLNLSFCNYHSNLNKDIKVKASIEDNYRQYAIQLDRQVNRIYGLPSILRDNELKFDKDKRYLKQRSNFKALLLALQDYGDGCIHHKDLEGINLLPVNYNDNNHQKVYEEYDKLLAFLSIIAKRSDHSMREWSDLLNRTWYQVHLLHDIVVNDDISVESLISIVDKIVDRLNNLKPSWKNQLTPTGREHVSTTVSKLLKLREWLRVDMEKYGHIREEDYRTKYRKRNLSMEELWEEIDKNWERMDREMRKQERYYGMEDFSYTYQGNYRTEKKARRIRSIVTLLIVISLFYLALFYPPIFVGFFIAIFWNWILNSRTHDR